MPARFAAARRALEGCALQRRQWEWHYLHRQIFPELLTLPEMTDEPAQVLFAPDGKSLIILGKDKEVRARDAATGAELPPPLKGTPVEYIAFAPDGKRVAAATTDRAILLWDVATGKFLHTLRGHLGAVVHLSFSPNGSRLASASWDKTAKIWDVATAKEVLTLTGHGGEIAWLAFRPDGRQLATASWDTTAKIWDLATGKEVPGPPIRQDQPLTQVAYAPDGTRLATVCIDRTVKFWDAATFRELPPLEGPMEDTQQIAFSPNGNRIAFAKKDKSIKIFDVQSGKKLFFLLGHLQGVTQVAYSHDGGRVVSTGKDRTVKVWDAAAAKETLSLPESSDVNHLAYSPDGQRRLAASLDKVVRIWDTDAGKELILCKGHSEEVVSLSYHPGGRRLATASKDKTVRIWDADTGKALHTLTEHDAEVTHVAYSPDGTRLVTAGLDRVINVREADTGKQLFSFKGLAGDVQNLVYSPDGRQLAVAARGAPARVWDPVRGKELFVLPAGAGDILYLAYNHAGTLLATAGNDHEVKLWHADPANPRLAMHLLPDHVGKVVHMTFSPDDRLLATAGFDKTIMIWDVATGTLRFTLLGHNGEVEHVAFSPDSQRLASASWDRTVKLWDMPTGRELLSLAGHAEEVTSVIFSPDGGQLASTSRGAPSRSGSVEGLKIMSDKLLREHLHAENSRTSAPRGLAKKEREITSPQGATIKVGGRAVINFCANNYLGLANHPAIIEAAIEGLRRYGNGMASVRFICGTQDTHKNLEAAIARFFGKDDAILYSSCWDANGGLFETILGPEDTVLSDELNHASIIDGIRLCKAQRYRYRNRDLADLEKGLRDAAKSRLRLIATDGVFSMDGVLAPLPDICALADRHDALLMVDDSHATGILGPGGRGTAEHLGILSRIDIITSTLGKTLGGAAGGFTCAGAEVVEMLRQRSRPYLFSNALPPAIVLAAAKALELVASGGSLRDKLHDNAKMLRAGLEKAGFTLKPGTHPIVPVMLGDAALAGRMADRLLEEGIYVVGFSYPVVAQGQARIRLQVSAVHTDEQLDRAVAAFTKVGREFVG